MKSSICEGLPKFTVGEDQAIKIMFWDQNRNDVIVTPSLEFLNMSIAYLLVNICKCIEIREIVKVYTANWSPDINSRLVKISASIMKEGI